MMTGPDQRGRTNPFLEPLELDELESRPEHPAAESEDPDVFERVTAVPGELDVSALMAEAEPAAAAGRDESPSGLYERTIAETERPAPNAPSSEPPPVLSAPAASSKRPARRASRPLRPSSSPGIERPSRRPSPSTPVEPSIELDLEPVSREPEQESHPDALEADLGWSARPPSLRRADEDPDIVAMKDRYATGDFSGALIVAEGILETNPNHDEARRCQTRCTEVLAQMYLARLGSLAQVVRVAVSGDQIRWLSLDHRAGFLLSLVDGQSSIETLLDISGMPRLEALRILFGLLDQRVIVLSDG
jgi:hypothetical protein